VNYSSGAPVRQPLPELPESDFPGTPVLQENHQGNERTLAYLRLLWAHREMLYRVSLYALLVSTIVAFLIPKRYESTAHLMPPDNQSSSGFAMAAAALSNGGASGGLGSLASDFLGLKSTSDIFVGILSSRTVQDKLIQQFELKKLYGTRSMEDTEKALAEHTGISVDRKSQIISITVTDKSPQRAAAMGHAYVEELNHLVAELSTSSARRERVFLEERLQAVSKDLENAEKDFSQFASKNAAIDVKEQAKAMVEAAATLQGQLIAAQSQYEGLREIYTDNNPRLRTVKARINELQRQLEKLGGKGESSTEVSPGSADSLYPSLRKLPLLGVAYADLYRRTRVQEAVFETLTKEYEMAKVQEAKEIPTVKVLDMPNIPDRKTFPPRLLIMFLGTACAFAVATVWLFASTSWDQTDAQDPRKVFALEVLTDLKAKLPRFVRNGSGDDTDAGAKGFLQRRRGSEDKDKASHRPR
jgi:capsule polysaccharide export protein KpsE/RkpR